METKICGSKYPVMEFENAKRLNPRWSSLTCFLDVLRTRRTMSRRVIRRAFENLVDAGDYRKKDKNEVLNYALSFAYNKLTRQRKQKSDLLL